MKKLRIFSLLLAVTLILTNFSGVLPFLANLISIPVSAADEEPTWTPSDSDWIDDQIPEPEGGYAYTFAVVGDTQTLLWYDLIRSTNNMGKMYDWIVKEAKNGKIDLVMGLGDISETNNAGKSEFPYASGKFDYTAAKKTYKFNTANSTRKNEYLYAKSNIDKLAANGIPYTIVRGNHDKPASTSSTEYTFDEYFKYDEYASRYADGMVGRYDGKYADGSMHNTYLKVEVAGQKYMIVNLDCGVSSHKEKADDILEWANRVVAANKDHKVIVTTHMFLSTDGYRDQNPSKQPEYYGLYGGQTIWNQFARKHENITMIISGHHKTWDIGRSQSTGDHGNTVTQLMIDPQRVDMPTDYPDTPGHGGTGLVAMLHFSKDGKTVDLEYYSTIKGKYFRPQNQFSFDLNALDNKTEYTDTNHTHIYAGDCDTFCDLCLKETRTTTVSHTYYNNCDPDCNVCYATRKASHKYTNTCDATCDNGCGTVRIPPHSFEQRSCAVCEYPVYQDFNYTIVDNKATVTKYKGTSAEVVIPDSINGYPVTNIGDYAFEKNQTITKVTVPSSVESIGLYAFSNCNKLTTVTFNSGSVLRTINAYAFNACSKLTGIVFPDTLCYIGDCAFYTCTGLTSIEIHEGFVAFERYSFYGCSNLKTVKMPNTVNMIRQHTFYGCSKLTDINFSSSLVTIGRYAFSSCTSLTQVSIPASVKVIEQSAFYCNNLKTVWYEGTLEDKNAIDINYTEHATNGTHNNKLKLAKWNFEACTANATDHTHTFSADCDTVCNNCGQIRTVTAKHVYTDACDVDCNTCGTINADAHKYDDGCDTTCNTCGAERVPPHEYKGDCDTECDKCKTTRVVSANHVYDNACDEDCNVCGAKCVIAHTFSHECDSICNECFSPVREATGEHKFEVPCADTCIYCRSKIIVEHVYDNALDADCNDCGAVREIDPNATLEPDTNIDENSGSSNVVLIIVIIVVVIAAGVGIGLWIFFKKRK